MAHAAQDKVAETRHTIADTIRDNPIPAAMVGIGLGWLMWNGRKDDHSSSNRSAHLSSARYADGTPYRSSAAYSESGTYGDSYRGTASYGRPDDTSGNAQDEGHSIGNAADQARERLSQAGESAREGMHDLADRAHDTFDRATERAGELKHTVAEQTRRQARRVEDTFYDNPLAIAAVTMALGVAAGMTVPSSDKEAQLMGGARDQLVDKARETLHDTRDKAKHVVERVAHEATDIAKDAARDEGLTA